MAEEKDNAQDFMSMWQKKKEKEIKSSIEVIEKGKTLTANEIAKERELERQRAKNDEETDFMTFFKDKKAKDSKGTAIGELIDRAENAEARQRILEKKKEELMKKLEKNIKFMDKAEKLILMEEKEHERLKKELDKLEAENKGLKEKNEKVSNELSKKSGILKELEDRMKDIEIKVKMYSTKLDELTIENKALRQIMSNKDETGTEGEEVVISLDLKNQINELKRIIEQKDKVIEKLMKIQ